MLAMMRTSSGTGRVAPTGHTSRFSMTRSSLTWSSNGSSPISSRNRVPWLAATNSPGLACSALVKAPRTWPKSWLSMSVSGMAPQLTAMKGRSDLRAGGVNGRRHQLLAHAALAGDQHVARGERAARDVLAHRDDRRALADQVMPDGRSGQSGRRGHGRERARPRGLGSAVAAQRALHAQRQVVELERLAEIVGGAQTQRLDGRLDTGVAGHEDHAQIRLQRARALEDGEPVQARHLDVAHHDVELLLRDAAQGFLAVPRDVDLIALGAQQPAHRILDDRFVVNDQYGRVHHYPSRPPRLRCFCISRSKNEGGSDITPNAPHRQWAYRHAILYRPLVSHG